MMRQKRRVQLSTNRAFVALIKKTSAPQTQPLVTSVLDISESGAKISGLGGPKKNQIVELFWTPLPNLSPLALKAVCVWSTKNKAGLRFTEISKKAQCVIRSLVKFHLESAPK